MKLLIIHLSDMHCTEHDKGDLYKVEKAVAAVYSLGHIDSAILLFTGDLTGSAKKTEFSVGKQMIGAFISKLRDSLGCGWITPMIIPGNHDIDLSNNNIRTVNEIEQWVLEDHISDELKNLDSFFQYSATKKCFDTDKICDVKVLSVNGLKIQVCLLNSAPFSTKMPDDKQFHYIPQRYREKLARKEDVDLKFTLMHHHYEWCEWNTKEMIKKSISSDDLSFFGHDHKSEQISSLYADGKEHRIIMGGAINFNHEGDSSFNALIYDDEKKEFDSYSFEWQKENELFIKHQNKPITKRAFGLSPSDEFVKKLFKDNQNLCLNMLDYYVFPKLTAGSEFSTSNRDEKPITVDSIFDVLKKDHLISITGSEGSGKTSLLRFLYKNAAELGYCPLIIDNRTYYDSNFERMICCLLEDQYNLDRKIALDAFQQIDRNKVIFLIDDADLIKNPKAHDALFSSILDSEYSLVYTTKEKNQNLEQLVKNRLQGKEISSLYISPMFKESRDSLIEKVGNLSNKDDDMIDAVKTAFDYLVQAQTNLFSFTPANTLQYVRFFFQRGSEDKSTEHTLSMVFENNIRNSLLSESKNESLGVLYISVLEYIANKMYFELKKEKIDSTVFSTIITGFNHERKAKINGKQFINTCSGAKIFGQEEDSLDICFYDKNTFAYFVARAINREFEKDSSKTQKIEYVMNHICFGINDTIVLFLSFIRSNTTVILNIARKADELLNDCPEWDFDKNLLFMREDVKLSSDLPNNSDVKKNTMSMEKIEQNRHELIRFRGIFDYSEKDVTEKRYVILKAFKYVQLIARALIDQYGTLENDEIDILLNTIFRIPQKVIYALLSPYQDNNDAIVKSIAEFAKEKMPDETVSESTIKKMLANESTVLALNILNDIAFNSTNGITIHVLNSWPNESSNYKIMKLMMIENAGNSSEFINKAIEAQKGFEKNKYAQTLISQIARKHIIYHRNIDHRLFDKLVSAKVFSEKRRTNLLLERGSKDTSKKR